MTIDFNSPVFIVGLLIGSVLGKVGGLVLLDVLDWFLERMEKRKGAHENRWPHPNP